LIAIGLEEPSKIPKNRNLLANSTDKERTTSRGDHRED